MKRFILILFVVSSFQDLAAQKISPYFPTPFSSSTSNRYETQITYFDLNFVNSNLQEFMSGILWMTLTGDTKYDLKDGKGTITETYTDKIAANRQPRNLSFSYTVFPVDGEFVIKSLKITGDDDAVVKFYVRYWSTNLNFDDVKKEEIVSNRYLQDRVSYSFNGGNSFIEVTNTTIENEEEFTKEFLQKKDLQQVEQSVTKKDEAPEARKLTPKRTHEVFSYKVLRNKRNLKFEQSDSYFKDKYAEKANLEKELEKFMSDKEVGVYIVDVKYETENDQFSDISFEVKKFQEKKGFLNVVNDIIIN